MLPFKRLGGFSNYCRLCRLLPEDSSLGLSGLQSKDRIVLWICQEKILFLSYVLKHKLSRRSLKKIKKIEFFPPSLKPSILLSTFLFPFFPFLNRVSKTYNPPLFNHPTLFLTYARLRLPAWVLRSCPPTVMSHEVQTRSALGKQYGYRNARNG